MELTRRAIWVVATLAVRLFYRTTRMGPPVPDGALLLVANHPNSLMDPALVRATAGRPIRFLAKSTLFEMPLLGWIVARSGAIPVYRRLDGADPLQNDAMFAAVEAALARGEAVCLFPEGVSHSSGRLEALRTGAARIALASAARGIAPTIVPIGLNFERKTRFRSRALVAFGPPVPYDDLVATGRHDLAPAVRGLTDRIARHMRALLVEADPREDAAAVVRIDELYSAARGVSRAPEAVLARRRLIAAGLARLRVEDPEQYAALRQQVDRYDSRLARFGLRDRHLSWTVPTSTVVWFAVRETSLALALGPIALAGLLVFTVPYRVTGWLARVAPSPDLRATWQAVSSLVTYGVWTAGLAGVVGWVWGGPAAGATWLGLVLLAPAALAALERERAVLRLVRAYRAIRQTPARARARLRRQQEEIAAVLERVADWLVRTPQPQGGEDRR